MTDEDEQLLSAFRGWVARLPRQEAVRRYRALTRAERAKLRDRFWEESGAALNSRDPYSDRFESLARCFDLFAEGDVADPLLSSSDLFRERADELRHPEEWREEQRSAAQRDRLSDRRLRALALASSCLAEGPIDARLRRIEDVLPQLKQLADQAVAEGDLDDESAIGEDIVGLWRLRDDLRAGS